MANVTITPASVVAGLGARRRAGLAGETIQAGEAVYLSAAQRRFLKASDAADTVEGRIPAGLALNNAAAGQPLNVQRSGALNLGAVLTVNTAYYLSATPGRICLLGDLDPADGVSFIGLARSTSVLMVGIQSTIVQPAAPADAPQDSFFDPDNRNAAITLSNDRLAAQNLSAFYILGGVRSVMGVDAGKYVSEFTVTNLADALAVGFVDASEDVAGIDLGQTAASVGVNVLGQVMIGNTFPTSIGALAEGDTVGFAIDRAARLFWIFKNGTVTGGNPDAGTGGFGLPVAITGEVHMAAAPAQAGAVLTWNPAPSLGLTSFDPWRQVLPLGAPTVVPERTNYIDGGYTAYASTFNRGMLVEGLGAGQYRETITVYPYHFPNKTIFFGHWPFGFTSGVRGYNHVSFLIDPVTVDNIDAFTHRLKFTLGARTGEFNILAEFYLYDIAGDLFSKSTEIAYFLHWDTQTLAYFLSGANRGTYTDPAGRVWDIRQVAGGDSGNYIMLLPADRLDALDLTLDNRSLLTRLKTLALIGGAKFIQWIAAGIEAITGDYTATMDLCAVTATAITPVTPGTVSDLAAAALSSSTARLTFTSALHATSHQYRLNGAGSWLTLPVDQIATGLTASTLYSFEVRGVNTAGNGAASNSADATTSSAGIGNVLGDASTGWSDPGGYDGLTDSGGKLNWSGSGNGSGFGHAFATPLIPGKYYDVTFTVTDRVEGYVRTFLYGGSGAPVGTGRNADGTYTEHLLASSPTANTTVQFQSTDTVNTLSVVKGSVTVFGPYDT